MQTTAQAHLEIHTETVSQHHIAALSDHGCTFLYRGLEKRLRAVALSSAVRFSFTSMTTLTNDSLSHALQLKKGRSKKTVDSKSLGGNGGKAVSDQETIK